MLKLQAVPEKRNPNDILVYALSILDRYENCRRYLDDHCFADST